MNWSAIGAILLALAVIIGAFGAHALQGMRAECSDDDGESQQDGADNAPIHT